MWVLKLFCIQKYSNHTSSVEDSTKDILESTFDIKSHFSMLSMQKFCKNAGKTKHQVLVIIHFDLIK